MIRILGMVCIGIVCGCQGASADNNDGTTLVLSGKAGDLFAENKARIELSFHTKGSLPDRHMPVRSPEGYVISLQHKIRETVFLDITVPEEGRVSFILINGKRLAGEGANKKVLLPLDKPRPWIKIAQEHKAFEIRYGADIQSGERVRWTELPYWDAKAKKLTLAKPPTVTMSLAGTPKQVLKTLRLDTSCLGICWRRRRIEPPDTVSPGDRLVLRVVHDTGDLFGKITTSQTLLVRDY